MAVIAPRHDVGRTQKEEAAKFEDVIADFRADPEMARFNTANDLGGCTETATRFAWYCQQRGLPYRWRKWKNLPGYRTVHQHNIEVEDLIVDWIYRQYEPDAAWPHVEPVSTFRQRFGDPLPICARCGLPPHTGRRCLGVFRSLREAAGAYLRVERFAGQWPR